MVIVGLQIDFLFNSCLTKQVVTATDVFGKAQPQQQLAEVCKWDISRRVTL
jgi:hypothetical protein